MFPVALLSVILISLISFVGAVTFALKEKTLRALIFILVSLSAGALFGDAFLHLIPESMEEGGGTAAAIAVIVGIFLFFILEKFLAWRHSHGMDEESMEMVATHDHTVKPLGHLVIIADGIHNLIDGFIIGASFMVGPEVGLATTIAVALHEIPQEIGDFGLLIHSGFSKSRALVYNFFSGLAAVIGLVLVYWIGAGFADFMPLALAFAAGGFIYIAGSDLVPEIQKTKEFKKSLLQVVFMTVGVAAMFSLLLIE